MGKKKKKAPLPPPPPPMESDDDGEYASLYDTPEVEPAAAAPAEQQTEHSQGNEGKKSKAQKRREKKEAEEEARDREIAEQSAVASVESRAAVERAALTSKLAELQRRVKEISPNGHCLYASVAHQLEVRGMVPTLDEALGESPLPDQMFRAVRLAAAQHLRAHKASFAPFLAEDPSTDAADPYEAHCESVENSAEWGGHMELAALSAVLKIPICVYEAGKPDCVITDPAASGEALELSFHRHMYSLGEHYNSVVPM